MRLLSLTLLLVTLSVSANVAPYGPTYVGAPVEASLLEETRDDSATENTQVQLVEEHVDIKFHHLLNTSTTADYVFRNLTPKTISVEMAVPCSDLRDLTVLRGDGRSTDSYGMDWVNYTVREGQERDLDRYAAWTVEFPPQGELFLRLEYSGESGVAVFGVPKDLSELLWGVEPALTDSPEKTEGWIAIEYSLFPGATWAGRIESFSFKADGLNWEDLATATGDSNISLIPSEAFPPEAVTLEWKNLEINLVNFEPLLEDIKNLWPNGNNQRIAFLEYEFAWPAGYDTRTHHQASSTLIETTEDILRFHAIKADDGDPSTCWCEGAEGDGVGESIEYSWEKEQEITEVTVIPGYATSEESFHANARPAELELSFSHDSFSPNSEALIPLTDNPEPQTFKIDIGGPVQSVRITIKSVYPGEKWDDCCIAEISFK